MSALRALARAQVEARGEPRERALACLLAARLYLAVGLLAAAERELDPLARLSVLRRAETELRGRVASELWLDRARALAASAYAALGELEVARALDPRPNRTERRSATRSRPRPKLVESGRPDLCESSAA